MLPSDELPPGVSYFLAQPEICPSTGRLHWQSFLQNTSRMRFEQVCKLFPGAHVEPMYAKDTSKLRDYCLKEDTRVPDRPRVELGTYVPCEQGKRSDLADLCALAMSGEADLHDLWVAHPPSMARYGRAIAEVLPYARSGARIGSFIGARDDAPEVIVLYGPTETGKTRFFMEERHPELWWEVPITTDGTLRFDGTYCISSSTSLEQASAASPPSGQSLTWLQDYPHSPRTVYSTISTGRCPLCSSCGSVTDILDESTLSIPRLIGDRSGSSLPQIIIPSTGMITPPESPPLYLFSEDSPVFDTANLSMSPTWW